MIFFKNLVLGLGLLPFTSVLADSTLNFDLHASPSNQPNKKCASMWFMKESHIIATVSSPTAGNQRVEFEIYDQAETPNKYSYTKDVTDNKADFTVHQDGEVFFCFSNIITTQGVYPSDQLYRTISLKVSYGKSYEDYETIAKAEKLKPREVELLKIEGTIRSVMYTMDYLKRNNVDKQAHHEIANTRIHRFNLAAIGILLLVGAWQVLYLRTFFKSKKLI